LWCILEGGAESVVNEGETCEGGEGRVGVSRDGGGSEVESSESSQALSI
jgi:hypothetical protein